MVCFYIFNLNHFHKTLSTAIPIIIFIVEEIRSSLFIVEEIRSSLFIIEFTELVRNSKNSIYTIFVKTYPTYEPHIALINKLIQFCEMTIQDTNTQKLAIKHFASLVINRKVHGFQTVK